MKDLGLKNVRLFLYAICLSIFFFSGCATAPRQPGISGMSYIPLLTLADSNKMDISYDTFSRIAVLSRYPHKVQLRVGDSFVVIDGTPKVLKSPVDINQGAVIVPYGLKEQIDALFKELPPSTGNICPLLKLRKIVIDAGHGGNDPGAIGRTGLNEKDVNLDIAKRLGALLRQDGVEVVFTRSTDRFITLERRVEISNASGADLFVSVHSNANRVRKLNGFEVYYISDELDDYKRALSFAKTEKLQVDNQCFQSPSLNLKATLWDMINTYNRGESLTLSRAICSSIRQSMDTRVIGSKEARFFVLKGASIPSVLVEVGFVSNPTEEKSLKKTFYRQKLAESIREGILNYAGELTRESLRNIVKKN